MASPTPHDVIVVGAGPAGLAAAMFTARRGLTTLICAKDVGGQLALTDWIENYPGIERTGGRELTDTFLGQAKRDGAELVFGEAVGIEARGKRQEARGNVDEMPTYVVRTAEMEELTTRTIILAFGLTPNDLGCEGEAHLRGRGLYYSAVADAPKQDGKTVAIVGGGNSAVTAALELAPRAEKVLLIHRRPEFRAERVLLDRLRQLPNVELLAPYTVAEVHGTDHVKEITIASADAERRGGLHARPRDGVNPSPAAVEGACRLVVDSVFVQIGFSAKTKWLEGVVDLNAKREVVIDRDCATNAPGIFAAGDLTDIAYKQAVVTAGEGVKAALQAFKYLQSAKGKPAVMFDWDARGK